MLILNCEEEIQTNVKRTDTYHGTDQTLTHEL